MAILGDSVPEVNRPSRNRVVRSCSAEAEGTQIGTSFPLAPRSSRLADSIHTPDRSFGTVLALGQSEAHPPGGKDSGHRLMCLPGA